MIPLLRENSYVKEPEVLHVNESVKLSTEEMSDDEVNKMSNIREPHKNDVLMGRGGKNNQHVGNEQLREIARERCQAYQVASKKGKSIISRDIVRIVREMDPPGRFLRKDSKTNTWEDVGNDIAREKASQVLRDAVALHSNLMTDADETSLARERLEKKAVCRRRSHDDQREYTASIRQSSRIEIRSGTGAFKACIPQSARQEIYPPNYHPYFAVRNTGHLPVTPVSSSTTDPRKRPRYHHETPIPVFHNTTHFHNSGTHLINHPQGIMMSPPSHPYRPNFTYYSSGVLSPHLPTTTTLNTPASSPNNKSHLVPSSGNFEPLAIDAPTFANQSDFDLFDGELLSDSARDESMSPLPCPDRHNL